MLVAVRQTRFDPRASLIAVIAGIVAVLLLNVVWKLGVCLFVCLIAFLWLKRFGLWLKYCRVLLPLIVLLFVFGWLTGEGLAAPVLSMLKLLALGSLAFWFFQTTPPEELAFALLRWGLPFGVVFIIAYSLRYVETLQRQWQQIREAQQLRGLVLRGWGWRHLPALLGPLLVLVFRLADELAEALETRGFGTPKRSSPFDFRLTLKDYILMAVVVVVTIIFYLV